MLADAFNQLNNDKKLVQVFLSGNLSPYELAYQKYYQLGMRAVWPHGRFFNFPNHHVARRIYSKLEMLVLWRIRRLQSNWPVHTARYQYSQGSGTVTFAIDASDGPDLEMPELSESVEIYFKANYWPQRRYPKNVYPIVNGNGMLSEARLRQLFLLRGRKKTYDVVFI